jgi:ubiquinone/menaquinone biosynthesis C-methylase UbiE
MAASIDALTSPTLKYLRERWWNDDFTDFLAETLRPRPGNRILDVGCGEGTAEVRIGRLHVSQIRMVGVDLMIERVMVARHQTAGHNQRVAYATADACRLPFHDGVFDSTFCVAVLQHIADEETAVAELSRVTRPGGRVLAVEPDNRARYFFAATPAGLQAFETSSRFFAGLADARREKTNASIGPRLPALFSGHGIEPLNVRLFPVSQVRVGAPPAEVWARRRESIEIATRDAPSESVRALGREYLGVLEAYAAEAANAGPGFVEIPNTMLFATVGQKA